MGILMEIQGEKVLVKLNCAEVMTQRFEFRGANSTRLYLIAAERWKLQ